MKKITQISEDLLIGTMAPMSLAEPCRADGFAKAGFQSNQEPSHSVLFKLDRTDVQFSEKYLF